MQDAFSFCAARVREADRDRFLATLFAPEPHREPLFALYAFDAEISEVRDRITQPLAGEVRLQWWRDVLAGPGPGDGAGNPVAAGLLETVRRFALPVPLLIDVIDAHTFDLYDEPMASLAALEQYADRTAGTVIRLAARILNDGVDPGLDAVSRHAGIASTIATLLQRLPQHCARGQCFLPDEVLARHGVAAATLLAGRATDRVLSAVAELGRVAGAHLAALQEQEIPEPVLPAFLPLSVVPSVLAGIGPDPFRPRPVPRWRRQWTLWRAARDPGRFVTVTRNGNDA